MHLEILDFLKQRVENAKSKIKPTTTDHYQFEKNVRNEFLLEYLEGNVSIIEKHASLIGENVFKYVDNFTYTTKEDYEEKLKKESSFGILNKIEKKPLLFTNELFEQFLLEYFTYLKSRLAYELCENSITSNSTNKISNAIFEWNIEGKQELHKIYKDILRKIIKK